MFAFGIGKCVKELYSMLVSFYDAIFLQILNFVVNDLDEVVVNLY